MNFTTHELLLMVRESLGLAPIKGYCHASSIDFMIKGFAHREKYFTARINRIISKPQPEMSLSWKETLEEARRKIEKNRNNLSQALKIEEEKKKKKLSKEEERKIRELIINNDLKFTAEEEQAIDNFDFFSNLDFIQSPRMFEFNGCTYNQNDINLTTRFSKDEVFKSLGGIRVIYSECGIFKKNELMAYINELLEIIKEHSPDRARNYLEELVKIIRAKESSNELENYLEELTEIIKTWKAFKEKKAFPYKLTKVIEKKMYSAKKANEYRDKMAKIITTKEASFEPENPDNELSKIRAAWESLKETQNDLDEAGKIINTQATPEEKKKYLDKTADKMAKYYLKKLTKTMSFWDLPQVAKNSLDELTKIIEASDSSAGQKNTLDKIDALIKEQCLLEIPVGFLLNNSNHSMAVIYKKKWCLMDINQFPPKIFPAGAIAELVEHIEQGFTYGAYARYRAINFSIITPSPNSCTHLLNNLYFFKKSHLENPNKLTKMAQRVEEDSNITLPHIMALHNDPFSLRYLVAQGLELTKEDKEGRTPLYLAAFWNSNDVAAQLIKYLPPDELNRLCPEQGAVHMAAIKNNEKILAMMAKKANLTLRDYENFTPLYLAANKGCTRAIKELVSHLTSEELDELCSGWAAIHIAAYKGHAKILAILLQAEAEASILNKDGMSPLAIAAYSGNKNVVEAIINYLSTKPSTYFNRLLNQRNKNGATALFLAARFNYPEIVKLLIAYGADLNLLSNGVTPLWLAAKANKGDMITVLLENGADINRRCKGCSPLWIAALRGNINAVCELLRKGADLKPVLVQVKDLNEFLLGFVDTLEEGERARMQDIIQTQIPIHNQTDWIAITPYDIAYITGQYEIMAIFKRNCENQNTLSHANSLRFFSQVNRSGDENQSAQATIPFAGI